MLSSFSRVCLYDPVDHSPPGSSVHGILQAWILEWVSKCPPSGALPDQGLNPRLFRLLHWQASSLPLAPPGNPLYLGEAHPFVVFKPSTNWLEPVPHEGERSTLLRLPINFFFLILTYMNHVLVIIEFVIILLLLLCSGFLAKRHVGSHILGLEGELLTNEPPGKSPGYQFRCY